MDSLFYFYEFLHSRKFVWRRVKIHFFSNLILGDFILRRIQVDFDIEICIEILKVVR